MILYEVRWEEGDGTNVEWFRNKGLAKKRKRQLIGEGKRYLQQVFEIEGEWQTPTCVEDIVQHTVEPNKDAFVRFLNHRANRDND
tara:strand:+ start:416 stop:670 length:255 start_codon:yes stop_codon:yes gene_type:complete